jgi:hypothetical protein
VSAIVELEGLDGCVDEYKKIIPRMLVKLAPLPLVQVVVVNTDLAVVETDMVIRFHTHGNDRVDPKHYAARQKPSSAKHADYSSI